MPAKKRRKPKRKPLLGFISYSHKDERRSDELKQHLALLEHEGLIAFWHDGLIDQRNPWDQEIKAYLKKADVILLLVSARFIKSYYCYNIEVTEALKRHRKKEAVVLPVIIGNADWETAPFAKLNACPANGRPIIGNRDRRDAGWTEVAKTIRSIVAPCP